MKKRLIAVFTGNRAEYGLQYPILNAIKNDKRVDYRLIVSGAHLDDNFGKTLKEIKKDGFNKFKEIKIKMDSKNLLSNAKAIGSGIISISKVLSIMKPDIFVVYADRFEGLAAVIASSQMSIPTAHIEGGDLTDGGALDDSVRHAMSKLSHLHFTTNVSASNRLLGMGEEKWRVKTVGFPAIDLIKEKNYASKKEIEKKLDINSKLPIILFTQHSVTTEFRLAKKQIQESLKAIKKLASINYQIIITYPNNDTGGSEIINELKKLKKMKIKNINIYPSIGRYMYHGILSLAKNKKNKITCVGNSSSGIKETAVFGCPTVNIGSRQSNRLRGDNILDVDYDYKSIIKATKKCMLDEKFRNVCKTTKNPYYLGGASKKIVNFLATIPINKKLIRKKMTLKGIVKNNWYK